MLTEVISFLVSVAACVCVRLERHMHRSATWPTIVFVHGELMRFVETNRWVVDFHNVEVTVCDAGVSQY